MGELNTQQSEAFSQMLIKGFDSSLESLSFLSGEKYAKAEQLVVGDFEHLKSWNDFFGDAELYALRTDLKGEVIGKNYLIFCHDKAQELMNRGKVMFGAKEEDYEMGRAFLLEIGNIVAGSAVSHFSNVTKKKIYGDVPALEIFSNEEKVDFQTELSNAAKLGLKGSTGFLSPNGKMQTWSVWFFEEEVTKSIVS